MIRIATTAAILLVALTSSYRVAEAQTANAGVGLGGVSVPRPGSPGANVLFGGAAGSPRPVEQTTGFGNTAASVYSTGRPLFTGATARAQSGGLAGTSGSSTTGGLFQFTSRVPTGGTLALPGPASVGGIGDIGTAAGTGGLASQSARSSIEGVATGGLSDVAGTSLTGGR